MKIKSLISVSFVLLICLSCAKKISKTESRNSQVAYNELKALVNSKSYSFNARSANPMQSNETIEVNNYLLSRTDNTGLRQDLSTNKSFISIKNDSIIGDLAYFGELRTSSYNDAGNMNIKFKGMPYQYETIINDRANEITVKFKIKGDSEDFNVIMVVFPNKNAKVSIYSSNRTAIQYLGEVLPI
ncbi:MAG: DUF4251 domain-containing protein [Winogradskyella sp.]|uniref:DUF4251 domain-containing protein n=1 Tax=Winogradskyella sp. TaxID=1883156 RepID=UPI00184D778B|nr:DUF4251 domain-containing protein [Winogradskyella sp.]